jgi:hypothetical protein
MGVLQELEIPGTVYSGYVIQSTIIWFYYGATCLPGASQQSITPCRFFRIGLHDAIDQELFRVVEFLLAGIDSSHMRVSIIIDPVSQSR